MRADGVCGERCCRTEGSSPSAGCAGSAVCCRRPKRGRGRTIGRLGTVPGGQGETSAQRETSTLQPELRGGTPGRGPTATGDRSNWRLGAGHWRGVGQAAKACRRLHHAAPAGAEGPPPFRGDGPGRRGQPPVFDTGSFRHVSIGDRARESARAGTGQGRRCRLAPAGRARRESWGRGGALELRWRGVDGAQGRWAAGFGKRLKAQGDPWGE